MINQLKIARLKAKARKYYKEYHIILDALGCGEKLAEYVSFDLRSIKADFNKTMEALAKLDKECPTTRL